MKKNKPTYNFQLVSAHVSKSSIELGRGLVARVTRQLHRNIRRLIWTGAQYHYTWLIDTDTHTYCSINRQVVL